MGTLKNKFKKAGFNDAHIEMRKGTVQDCVDYCSKEETRVDGLAGRGNRPEGSAGQSFRSR